MTDQIKEKIKEEMLNVQTERQHDLVKAKLDQHEITKDFFLTLIWEYILHGKYSSGEFVNILEGLEEEDE